MTATALERLERAEAAYTEALKAHGDESLQAAHAAAVLGEAHCDAGNVQQALVYLEKAILVRIGSAGLEGKPLMSALETVAYVHGLLGDDQEQQATLQRVIELQERAGDQDALAASLLQLSDLCARRGQPDIQVRLIERAQDLSADGALQRLAAARLSLLAPAARPSTGRRRASEAPLADAAALRLLGMLLLHSGDYAACRWTRTLETEAIECLDAVQKEIAGDNLTDQQRVARILELVQQMYGEDSMQAALWLALAAELHGTKGDFHLARRALRQVLRIQEREHGFDSVYVAWTLRALAHAEGKLGNADTRWDLLHRALEIQEEELGADHTHTVMTRFYLGEATAERKKLKDPLGTRELEGLFTPQPPTNPKVNRWAGEIMVPIPTPEQNSKGGSRLGSSELPFRMCCTGGGSCACREAGIDVPFYFSGHRAACC